MVKTSFLFKVFRVFELDNFHLYRGGGTSLLMSGRKEPMASRKGYWVLFENPNEKMFHGAVYVIT